MPVLHGNLLFLRQRGQSQEYMRRLWQAGLSRLPPALQMHELHGEVLLLQERFSGSPLQQLQGAGLPGLQ